MLKNANIMDVSKDLERIAELEALYQGQIAAEKAKEIARDEECLQQSKEDLLMLQESMAETKEEIADVVTKWFSQNEIEPDAVLTTVQKNLLNHALYFIKQEEQILANDIDMAIARIRDESRWLRHHKGDAPTAEEKAQEDAEVAAERRFNEVSRRAAMPQFVRDDLYERSEYQGDLITYWNNETERCERIIHAREKEMLERMEMMN